MPREEPTLIKLSVIDKAEGLNDNAACHAVPLLLPTDREPGVDPRQFKGFSRHCAHASAACGVHLFVPAVPADFAAEPT